MVTVHSSQLKIFIWQLLHCVCPFYLLLGSSIGESRSFLSLSHFSHYQAAQRSVMGPTSLSSRHLSDWGKNRSIIDQGFCNHTIWLNRPSVKACQQLLLHNDMKLDLGHVILVSNQNLKTQISLICSSLSYPSLNGLANPTIFCLPQWSFVETCRDLSDLWRVLIYHWSQGLIGSIVVF